MVVGNGLIASAFLEDYSKDDKFIIFASGVSNSLETNLQEFEREKNLLIKILNQNKEKHIVYFTSFIDNDERKRNYISHKEEMVKIIRSSKNYYTILKLPQVMGNSKNSHTLINYLVNHIQNKNQITVYKNVYKAIIDVDDVKKIVDILIKKWNDKNTFVEFSYIEKISVYKLVKLLEKILKKPADVNIIDAYSYDLPNPSLAVIYILKHLNIKPKGYTKKVLKKYINK